MTVGYERIRGLRDVGQDRSGRYSANKSRTFAAPVSALYRAFHDARRRVRWLGSLPITIRTSQLDKSMRITWPDGTSVHAYFTAKGEAKSSVAIQHVDLSSKEDIERAKAAWAERFDALAASLSPRSRSSRSRSIASTSARPFGAVASVGSPHTPSIISAGRSPRPSYRASRSR